MALLRFSEFHRTLHESFVHGFKTSLGYVEVFKDPTTAELQDILQRGECAAVLYQGTVYAWNRDKGSHQRVMQELNSALNLELREMVPVFLNINVAQRDVLFTTSPTGKQTATPDLVKRAVAAATMFRSWEKSLIFA